MTANFEDPEQAYGAAMRDLARREGHRPGMPATPKDQPAQRQIEALAHFGGEPFTSTDLREAAGLTQERAQHLIAIMRVNGRIRIVGKRGNFSVYQEVAECA
ncbi:hypothetical protein [Halovulum sp. GXIMD14793]